VQVLRAVDVLNIAGSVTQATFTWDALGRRIEFVNSDFDQTTEYWYDGVKEIDEKTTQDGEIPSYTTRYYIHGVSYVDEHLLMLTGTKPYYYVLDRMYNVRLLLDRAGAIVERYAYDSYGRPRIRESCGRGDMNNDTKMSSGDTTRFDDANADTIWDPRADMDDDGDVDAADETAYDLKYSDWSGVSPSVDPRQAFSDKGNPFMFQGIPHFALDTASSATEGKLMLNHHRARFADPVTGRWISRDPLFYDPNYLILRVLPPNNRLNESHRCSQYVSPFGYLCSRPNRALDPSGLIAGFANCFASLKTS
jgi:hypothetical protein